MGGNQVANRSRHTRKSYTQRSTGRAFRLGSASRFYKSRQKGQELLEFAVILPLLMLVVFGVLDLGRGLHAAIAITNVAREGARFGIDFDWQDPFLADPIQAGYDAIEIIAFDEAQNSSLDLSLMNVSADCDFCVEDLPLTVTVTYDFNLIMGIIPGFTITRTNTMMLP